MMMQNLRKKFKMEIQIQIQIKIQINTSGTNNTMNSMSTCIPISINNAKTLSLYDLSNFGINNNNHCKMATDHHHLHPIL
jgi:hypothetical protein